MQTKPKSNSVVTSKHDDAAKTLTFTVLGDGGGTATLHLPKLSPTVVARAVVQGMNQRCANAAALPHDKTTGKAATPAEKFTAIQKLVDHYNTGTEDWSPARAEGTIGLDAITLAAVVEVTGKDEATVRTMIEAGATKNGITQRAYLARLGTGKTVAPVVERLRAAQTPDIDPDADLEAMMGETTPEADTPTE